jgi:glucose uptake protein
MFIVENYGLAVALCVVTMICWGSWANTQKLAGSRWRFELFYWDYVLGILVMAVIFAFTLGSTGCGGRPFMADLRQADAANLGSAFLGGMVFNAANILLVAAIAVAGMSVAFPVGIGLALVLGVVVNYRAEPGGNVYELFAGVGFVTLAIVLDALAYSRLPKEGKHGRWKGLILALLCGVLMGFFYRFVAAAMPKAAVGNFVSMPAGKLSPYSAMVLFSLGVLGSQVLFNFANIIRALTTTSLAKPDYLKGTPTDHLWGLLGGMIWAIGMTLNIIALGAATPAISYGLGQGATMVAAFWGVFVWREFHMAPPGTRRLLTAMFVAYAVGLGLIILARIGA